MVVGILGILKAGGAYVPVDVDYPAERIGYMLEDTGASVALSSRESRVKLPVREGLEIIETDGQWGVLRVEEGNLGLPVKADQLAYVIYTSGSTGRPKGVMVEHGSLLNYLLNSKARYVSDKGGGSGSFIHLSFTFDASLTGMFMPLLSGKAVIVGSKQGVEVFEDSNLWKYGPYDFIKITPSHLELLQGVMLGSDGRLVTDRLVIG
ncbi:MAG: AMP-binding protein, partial [Nostoc sp.]